MEELDRAMEREKRRLDPKIILKPAEAHSLNDIKRLVSELDPRRNPPQVDIPLAANLLVREDNKDIVYRAEANTRSKSRRDTLVEGLSIIKNRVEVSDKMEGAQEPIEVNGIPMKPAQIGNGVVGQNWVDPLIKHWLGGYRDGILICWNLNDGFVYRYDIFTHKLIRVECGVEREG
jgi:hypothetical protein